MPKVTFTGDAELIRALDEDSEFPLTERTRQNAVDQPTERMGFELGSVEILVGHLAAGVHLYFIVEHLLKAARSSKSPRLEICSPMGRISVDLAGKSDKEVAALLKAALPFVRADEPA
ncbi:MAG: hypothetical protein JSR45_08460 [Proteobacteria bacterium]|nr:hypothetical protein [Pseudomonadota bacterium]